MANLSSNAQQLGFIDFSAIGSSITALLPSAIDALGKKQVAKVYAKAAAISNPAPAAQPAVSVTTLQPTTAAPKVAFDYQSLIKPGLVGLSLLAAVVVLPRLIPQGRN